MPGNFEPVSSVDSAWLAMEQPTNLMMMTGIITFREPVELSQIQEILEKRWLIHRRFRQRVVHPKLPFAPSDWAPAFWEPDPTFHLDNHLEERVLPDPGGYAELQQVINELMSTQLDVDRPLWSMHLIQNYQGGSVLALRVHHVIADGISMVGVLLSVTDDHALPLPEEDADEPSEDHPPGSLLEEALETVLRHTSTAACAVLRMSEKLIREVLEALSDPDKAMDLAKAGTEGAQTIRRLLLMGSDPETMLRGELGVSKVAAWSQPIPLRQVKEVKNRLGGTVNDVLINAVAGGVRRFLIRNGQPVDGLDIRAAIPVNLRKPKDFSLGNKFGLVFLSLPIGIEDPVERLQELRSRMDKLKQSNEAPFFFGLLKSLGYAPAELQNAVADVLAERVTAVMSNVPGPRNPLHFAGQEVESMMFWVPQSGRVGLGVSLLSYDGKVYVGVNTDAGLVPHPDQVIDGFYEDYLALLKAADDAESPDARARCRASTRRGPRCKNRALPGTDFCRVHAGGGNDAPAP